MKLKALISLSFLSLILISSTGCGEDPLHEGEAPLPGDPPSFGQPPSSEPSPYQPPSSEPPTSEPPSSEPPTETPSNNAEDIPPLTEPSDNDSWNQGLNPAQAGCTEPGEVITQGGRCIDGSGRTDVTAIIQAEIDALPPAVGMGSRYFLPHNAKLRVSGRGIMLKDRIMLFGNDTRLIVENGSVGVTMGPGNGANWSSVSDLVIVAANGNQVHDGIGIDVRTHGARVDNIYIERMGTGIRVITNNGDEFANVNSPQIRNVVVRYAHHYAMYLRGGDSNAGLISGLEVIGGEGVLDASFLGNTWLAPMIHTDEDAQRALDLGHAAASNLVLGAYLEFITPPPTSAGMNDLWVGGHSAERLLGRGERVGRQSAKLNFKGDDGVRVKIPWDGADTPLAIGHPGDSDWWMLRYDPRSQVWGWRHRTAGADAYRWTGTGHPSGAGVMLD